MKLNRIASPLFILLLTGGTILAQDQYYFHTIHSHGLSLTGGRTAKLNYMYQIGRGKQFKFSGTYIHDAYVENQNHISSNIYNLDLQLQFTLINIDRFFLNVPLGAGGYYLKAKDLLDIGYDEWRFNFVSGLQGEYYLLRNSIALTIDYDFLFMPWSRIYTFLHIPTVGVTFFFF